MLGLAGVVLLLSPLLLSPLLVPLLSVLVLGLLLLSVDGFDADSFVVELALVSLVFSDDDAVVLDDESLFRLSVTYQPDPLKMIPTGWNTRLVEPPQVGQTLIGSSSTRWRISNRFEQLWHSYS